MLPSEVLIVTISECRSEVESPAGGSRTLFTYFQLLRQQKFKKMQHCFDKPPGELACVFNTTIDKAELKTSPDFENYLNQEQTTNYKTAL